MISVTCVLIVTSKRRARACSSSTNSMPSCVFSLLLGASLGVAQDTGRTMQAYQILATETQKRF